MRRHMIDSLLINLFNIFLGVYEFCEEQDIYSSLQIIYKVKI